MPVVMQVLVELQIHNWQEQAGDGWAEALEAGRVLFAPGLNFELTADERCFLTPECADGKAKNVSFRGATGVVQGTRVQGAARERLTEMMRRYAERSAKLMHRLLPEYGDRLTAGFTSFRPAEIAGRKVPWRKDDTRLHLDAFPSRPMHGVRILRVFTNVHPQLPRLWRVGEPFQDVAKRFTGQVRPQLAGVSWLLHRLHITKTRRTRYDHLMLGIHDRMKADERYQRGCPSTELWMPPGATWACFTDAVPHAALAGQFAFEQTFYLPVEAMRDPERSPLRILERLTGRALA
jgi:hypothetical protein